eukprot:CAMPEP_0172510570 /NCGR_PEP_ID=MMETSP1066-20121228/229571_1 /TAXON_ID=671091 /ORGANISM="Coscinodiscus wailesii, Strain CCMP2513" /LENGTH=789 /DNA_ID=CAMNT_0013289591 /DNA_START=63 /DNA_END=2432 /DNA_ORIENTATION=+
MNDEEKTMHHHHHPRASHDATDADPPTTMRRVVEPIHPLAPGAYPEIVPNTFNDAAIARSREQKQQQQQWRDGKKNGSNAAFVGSSSSSSARAEPITALIPGERPEIVLPTDHDEAIARAREEDEQISKIYDARRRQSGNVSDNLPPPPLPPDDDTPAIAEVIDPVSEDGIPIVDAVVMDDGDPNGASAPSNANLAAVDDGSVVKPRVMWRWSDRRWTDKTGGVIFGVAYLAFIVSGLYMVANARPLFRMEKISEGGNITKVMSTYYRDEVKKCCESQPEEDYQIYDLCYESDLLGATTARGNNRNLRDDVAASSGRQISGNDGKPGLFDAFIAAPEVIIGLSALAVGTAVLWTLLLQAFAGIIVFATEAVKIGIIVYLGVLSRYWLTLFLCVVTGACIFVYAVWFRQRLVFAGRMLSYSSKALRENKMMIVGLSCVVIVYVLNAWVFIFFLSKGSENVRVESVTTCYNSVEGNSCRSSCEMVYPSYLMGIYVFHCLAYLWTILLFNKIRLSIIAYIIGSWHFKQDEKPTIVTAVINSCTISLGTLSLASLVSTISDQINRSLTTPWWKSCCITLPLHLIMCLFGTCINAIVKTLSKFAVILHIFTGLPFIPSGKKACQTMSRHFKGGFVTEVTSQSVLNLACYVFSAAMALTAWAWFDGIFGTSTMLSGSQAGIFIVWLLFGLFNLWFPSLGIYIIIVVNSLLRELNDSADGDNVPLWVSPLAGIFVGCLAMLFFCYIAGIFMDTVDVLFMCYAIDKDNQIDTSESEMQALVMAMPVDIVIAQPVDTP